MYAVKGICLCAPCEMLCTNLRFLGLSLIIKMRVKVLPYFVTDAVGITLHLSAKESDDFAAMNFITIARIAPALEYASGTIATVTVAPVVITTSWDQGDLSGFGAGALEEDNIVLI